MIADIKLVAEGQRYQHQTYPTVIIRITKVPSSNPGYDFDVVREDIPNHIGDSGRFEHMGPYYNLINDRPSFTCKYCYGRK